MKTTKRILSILLSLIIALAGLAALCIPASAYSTIEFGNYPQSRIEPTIKMKDAAKAAQWKSYGYYVGTGETDGTMKPSDFMQYADFVYNGTKYRVVTFSQYRPSNTYKTLNAGISYQDDNGYETGEMYFFKYEPLEWRVLDYSTGLVMCESIIDAQAFNNYVLKAGKYFGNASKDYYASNYYYSSIRKWLNEDFYNTAFNNAQKEKIKTTTLDNSAEEAQYSAPSSSDKVFLLSLNEVTNTSYGFVSSDAASDAARAAKGTDYAKCQGLGCHVSGNSMWWLRSPSNDYNSMRVISDGEIRTLGIDHTADGIRPACVLTSLKSDTTPNGCVKSVSVSDVKLNYKSSANLNTQINADSSAKCTVKYESSNTKVATVDQNGKIYGAKKGTAEIKVTVTDEFGNEVNDTCKVTVKYSFVQWIIVIILFGWLWY